MTLAGIHFLDGNVGSSYGGAFYISSSALVSIEGCKLSSNQARYGGGIAASRSGTTVNLYSTIFDGNTATNGGDDIYVADSASGTVHSTCPQDWIGEPAAGSNLDTYACNGSSGSPCYDKSGTLSGTTKSFDIG